MILGRFGVTLLPLLIASIGHGMCVCVCVCVWESKQKGRVVKRTSYAHSALVHNSLVTIVERQGAQENITRSLYLEILTSRGICGLDGLERTPD